MGFSLCTYLLLAGSGAAIVVHRWRHRPRPAWLRPLHIGLGIGLVTLVLVLLTVGLVGTLGHYGSLGHSPHLVAGLLVVSLVVLSAGSATQIRGDRPWARPLHVGINLCLFLGFAWVGLSGWDVVQKYLP